MGNAEQKEGDDKEVVRDLRQDSLVNNRGCKASNMSENKDKVKNKL